MVRLIAGTILIYISNLKCFHFVVTDVESVTSQTGQGSSSKVVRNRRKRANTSVVWDHYDVSTDAKGIKRARCKHCPAKDPTLYLTKDGTSNMKRHLEMKHPEQVSMDISNVPDQTPDQDQAPELSAENPPSTLNITITQVPKKRKPWKVYLVDCQHSH